LLEIENCLGRRQQTPHCVHTTQQALRPVSSCSPITGSHALFALRRPLLLSICSYKTNMRVYLLDIIRLCTTSVKQKASSTNPVIYMCVCVGGGGINACSRRGGVSESIYKSQSVVVDRKKESVHCYYHYSSEATNNNEMPKSKQDACLLFTFSSILSFAGPIFRDRFQVLLISRHP
jgi:hypothetical protein